MSTIETGFFGWLMESSWQAALLAVLVVLVQLTLGKRLQPRWRYLLWFLVLGRLLIPSLPESPVSMYRYVPSSPAQAIEPLYVSVQASQFLAATKPGPEPVHDLPLFGVPTSSVPWPALLFAAWLAGVVILFSIFLLRNFLFYRKIGQNETPPSHGLQSLCAELAGKMGIREPRIVETSRVDSPAIVGMFRVRLLLPEGLDSQLDREEMEAVLLHELAHVKRGDLWVNLLASLLQILHWFNPLLWLAFARMSLDRELATDSLALSIASGTTRESYGHTLLKLIPGAPSRNLLQPSLGILENHRQLKNRIDQIARFSPRAYAWSLLGMLILAGLGGLALTRAQETSTVTDESANTILVWKVASFPPSNDKMISDTTPPADLEAAAEKLGYKLKIKTFTGDGFTEKLVDAVSKHA